MESVKRMQDREKRTLNAILSEQSPEQLQAIGIALAEAAAESQALISEVMATSRPHRIEVPDRADPFGLLNSYSKLGQSLATNPTAMLTANLDLWMGWVNLWKEFTTGEISAPRDKRFSDPEWSANPAFEFMRKAYELNAEWMMSVLNSADDMSVADKRKAQFYTRQTIDALSPTNFFATNPAALKAMLESGGQSLVDGLRNARNDLKKGRGRLSISQTDESPFEVGKNVATAPGKVVYRNKLIELLQFEPTTEKVHSRPLLIFPPWINKYYILDLREENSMIRWLVDNGITVFVVSWRSADEVTRDFSWDDYIEHGVMAAVHEATTQTGSEDTNTVGYCIGGTLLTSALGHMAKTGDKRIASATYFASQTDFSDAGDLMVFTDENSRHSIEQVMEANNGIMPGELMGETFNWLRPVDLVWRYVIDNYMLGKQPRPFDLLFWNADQTNIPAKTHHTYLNALYGRNELAEGKFKVFGDTIDMGDITIPVTIQASREDHICPWHSIYRGARKFGGDVNFVLAGSGHIVGVVNHPSARTYQHWINPDLPATPEAWIAGAEEAKGSWWPEWLDWLAPKSGELIDAKPVPDRKLGDAPGTYVKMRLKAIAAGEKPATTYSAPAEAKPKPKAAPKRKPSPTKKTGATSKTTSRTTTSAAEVARPDSKQTGPAKKAAATKKATTKGKASSSGTRKAAAPKKKTTASRKTTAAKKPAVKKSAPKKPAQGKSGSSASSPSS